MYLCFPSHNPVLRGMALSAASQASASRLNPSPGSAALNIVAGRRPQKETV